MTLRDETAKQVRTLNCLLEQHVQLLGAEQQLKNAKDELLTVNADIQTRGPSSGPSKGQPSEADIRALTRLVQQKDELRSKIATAEKAESDARLAIMYGACEKR